MFTAAASVLRLGQPWWTRRAWTLRATLLWKVAVHDGQMHAIEPGSVRNVQIREINRTNSNKRGRAHP